MTSPPKSLIGANLLRHMIENHHSNECLLWPMKRDRDGYGRVWFQGKIHGAHRLAFFLTYGRWPSNALHSCDNPPCFNPRHIGEGTTAVNQREKAERGRSLRGEQQHDAKLTEQGVIVARMLYLGGSNYRDLAKQYGVTPTAMRWAVTGKTWSHIPGAVRSRQPFRPRQPFCSKGHSLDGGNAYSYPNGKRYCKICTSERARRRRAKLV